jgi:hypothetical protein
MKTNILFFFFFILQEIRKRKANCIGYSCVEIVFYNGLLKERYKGG